MQSRIEYGRKLTMLQSDPALTDLDVYMPFLMVQELHFKGEFSWFGVSAELLVEFMPKPTGPFYLCFISKAPSQLIGASLTNSRHLSKSRRAGPSCSILDRNVSRTLMASDQCPA